MRDALIARVKAQPPDATAFLELGMHLALEGNLPGLNELLTYRNHRGGSGSALVFELCGHLIATGRDERVLELCRSFDQTNAFSAALHGAAGLAHFFRFEPEAGLATLREGVRRLLKLAEQHPRETLPIADLTKLVAAAFLFEPLDWAPPAPDALPPPDILYSGSWATAAALCAAFGDARYFCKYAERLAEGFFHHAGPEHALFIGIVNPDAGSLALAHELAQRHPDLTLAVTHYQGCRLPEYCCSVRFMLAEALLEMAGRPLLLFDIDSCFGAGSAEVLKMIRSFALAHIRTREIWPQLLIDASVVGAHPGPKASRFFGFVTAYVQAKLQETGPLWTHDQVALYRAIALLNREGGESTNINTVLPARLHLPGFFKRPHTLSQIEREKTRSNDLMALTGLGPDLKPLFAEQGKS